jgi:hypothetical protein
MIFLKSYKIKNYFKDVTVQIYVGQSIIHSDSQDATMEAEGEVRTNMRHTIPSIRALVVFPRIITRAWACQNEHTRQLSQGCTQGILHPAS